MNNKMHKTPSRDPEPERRLAVRLPLEKQHAYFSSHAETTSPSLVWSRRGAAKADGRERAGVRAFPVALLTLLTVALLATGCGGAKAQKQNGDFFTSGSRDADQRASQRMAQAEQLNGSGEGAGEKDVKKAGARVNTNGVAAMGTNQAARAVGKLALYDRLGGEAGISNIVADFTPRALQDPRVNWDRKGEKVGGLSIHRSKSVAWDASPENVAMLQK